MAPDVEVTLLLECWGDELSPAQKAAYEKAEKEHNEVRNKLKEIVQETGGRNIFSGQVFTAYQVLGPVPGLDQIAKPITSLSRKRTPSSLTPSSWSPNVPVSSSPEPSTSGRRRSRRSDVQPEEEVVPAAEVASDDVDEDYIPLSKRMRQKDKDKTTKDASVKKLKEDKVQTSEPRSPRLSKSPSANAKIAAISVRPTEFNSIGGLQVGIEKDKKRAGSEVSAIVDLTKDDTSKPSADSREISFSKIQGKTFPSLVVLARPSLRVSEKAITDRPQLDAKVKSVLIHPAPKFTEWLIQQGLIRSEQTCQVHKDTPLKLGMYSDTSKFPYSGGYFWISDCCPTRFTSVFNGSLFEGSPHPPSVILKLIYHWACQTNISNVVSWVKVENVYLKGLYTLLRSTCTLALCRHMSLLGGPNKFIEIGVISLGTTTQDGQQRQVKVEVLGVLDQETKTLRLRAVEPLMDGDRSYKKRFSKILEPLTDWVSKDSTILTDLTVDKGTLISMGYKSVLQVSPAEANGKNSNANIMDYLRRIVPRMFQNTLSLLSRQIIQQFLNELVWRELYGNSPGSTFDNIVKHLAEEAKIETKDTLITRLNKAAADPFKHWEIVPDPPTPVKIPAKRGRKPKNRSIVEPSTSAVALSTTMPARQQPPPPKKNILKKVKREEQTAASTKPGSTKRGHGLKETVDETVPLESYYYSCAGGQALKESALPCDDFEVTCPECPTLTFHCNTDLLDHLLLHISPRSGDNDVLCRVCLEHLPDQEELKKHRNSFHPLESKSLSGKTSICLICEQRFSSVAVLVAHLQKSHVAKEMPYRCAGCDFRSSTHITTVDHFYERHAGSSLLQCPFCLKMACAFRSNNEGADENDSASSSLPLMRNVKMFMEHLRQHTSKTISKRCNKCTLSFLSKGAYKLHNVYGHNPNASDESVKPIANSVTKIFTPKRKIPIPKDALKYRVIQSWSGLAINMKSGYICMECGDDYDEFNHITGLVQCIKCPYQTSCLMAMMNHAVTCTWQASAMREQRPASRMQQEMHCNCGFSSFDGYALARHLVVCDSGGAVYQSVEAAQANVAERSMLDMLGLVRRDEDEEISQLQPQPERESAKEVAELNSSSSREEAADGSGDVYQAVGEHEPSTSGVSYDPSQSLYNIAGTGDQQFNTQLSFDDLGPPSVLPVQDNDRTPQLKDEYQSLATPRVPDQSEY